MRDATEEPRTLSLYGDNAGEREAVAIDVKKSKGFSTTDVAAQVIARLGEVRTTLPAGTTLDIVKDAGARVERTPRPTDGRTPPA